MFVKNIEYVLEDLRNHFLKRASAKGLNLTLLSTMTISSKCL